MRVSGCKGVSESEGVSDEGMEGVRDGVRGGESEGGCAREGMRA